MIEKIFTKNLLLLLHPPAVSLEWSNLIEIDYKDGQDQPLCVIDFIIIHSDSKVDDFAQLLLKDQGAVERLHNKSRDKEEFVLCIILFVFKAHITFFYEWLAFCSAHPYSAINESTRKGTLELADLNWLTQSCTLG